MCKDGREQCAGKVNIGADDCFRRDGRALGLVAGPV